MKRILQTMTAAVGTCALLGSPAFAQESYPADSQGQSQDESRTEAAGTSGSEAALSSAGSKFVEQVSAENAAEVKLGTLAQQKASSGDVKEFAGRMVEDHQKADDQLKRTVPAQSAAAPEDLERKHQKTYDQLSKLSGDEFDREYIKHMVKDHEKAVKMFRKQAERTSDRELSQFAQSTLPTLEEHLEEAKRIQQELRSETRGTSGAEGTTGTRDGEGSGIDDDGAGTSGTMDPGDDIDQPGHSEPPPPSPMPDPTERP